MTEIEPGILAEFDQAWADIGAGLDEIIADYKERLERIDTPRELHISYLTNRLMELTCHQVSVEFLVCAIDRLILREHREG